MRTRFLTLGTTLAIVLMIAGMARAQGRGGAMSAFGNTGLGSSGFGSSGFGNSGFGNSGFGGGGMGGRGFGSSGFGNSGFGGGGFGNSPFGQGGFGNSGFGNSGFGNSGFGGQYGGGQQFVGRDATDMQGAFQQTSRAQTQFFNNMNRQFARQNRDRRPATTTENPPQPMRVEVRVAFQAPRPTSEVVANTLRARLTKILSARGMSQPVVTMQGDTAILTGVAASDSERQVIGQLAALEQGVREVRNEMTVAGEATAASVQ
jgi:PPE-repeat protein